jgi:hypothetical protein
MPLGAAVANAARLVASTPLPERSVQGGVCGVDEQDANDDKGYLLKGGAAFDALV